jgi:multicomponent K+:H+ antiporter subunit E
VRCTSRALVSAGTLMAAIGFAMLGALLDAARPAAWALFGLLICTVWAELAPDRSALLLHVFDVDTDDADFVAHFKARYERPLLEIFQ